MARKRAQVTLRREPRAIDARLAGRHGLTGKTRRLGQKARDVARALLGLQRAGAEDEQPARPHESRGPVKKAALERHALGRIVLALQVQDVGVAADGAGRAARGVEQHRVEGAARIPGGHVGFHDLRRKRQAREVFIETCEPRGRMIDGRHLGASGRKLGRLAAGRGAEIGDAKASDVAEETRGKRRGRVLHPPGAVRIAFEILDARMHIVDNFEISRTVESVVRAAGEVKRLSIAVVVDGRYETDANAARPEDAPKDWTAPRTYVPRSDEELDKIATLVKSAVGFDASRGDTVEVLNMPFAETDFFEGTIDDGSILGFPRAELLSLAETLALSLVAVLAILAVFRPLISHFAAAAKAADLAVGPGTPGGANCWLDGFDQCVSSIDVDASLLLSGDRIIAMSYGGELASLDVFSGEIRWRRSIQSYTGATMIGDRIFVTDSAGAIWALDAETGAAAWKQEALAWRRLSPPAAHEGFVAVADFEGYVHYLAPSDGRIVGRTRALNHRVDAPMVNVDGRLYMQDINGRIAVLELTRRN